MERLRHLEEDNERLNQRVSLLEIQNRDQEQEIRSLKTEKASISKGSTRIDPMVEGLTSDTELHNGQELLIILYYIVHEL